MDQPRGDAPDDGDEPRAWLGYRIGLWVLGFATSCLGIVAGVMWLAWIDEEGGNRDLAHALIWGGMIGTLVAIIIASWLLQPYIDRMWLL